MYLLHTISYLGGKQSCQKIAQVKNADISLAQIKINIPGKRPLIEQEIAQMHISVNQLPGKLLIVFRQFLYRFTEVFFIHPMFPVQAFLYPAVHFLQQAAVREADCFVCRLILRIQDFLTFTEDLMQAAQNLPHFLSHSIRFNIRSIAAGQLSGQHIIPAALSCIDFPSARLNNLCCGNTHPAEQHLHAAVFFQLLQIIVCLQYIFIRYSPGC